MKTELSETTTPATAGAVLTLSNCHSDCVGVVRTGGHHHLVATRSIAAGEVLFRLEGEITARPSRYSVQIEERLHIAPPKGADAGSAGDRYFWRFMNHSCEPSVRVRGQVVSALRALPPGEEVTFDYETTEYEMAEPFGCHCGGPRCRGLIRGFKHLAPSERGRLRPWLAPHLLRHVDSPSHAGAFSEGA